MITILTPTYNRKYTLKKAYDSLLKQKDKDFEWLIIDDGSTDDTEQLIKELKEKDKIPIRYYYKKNGGKHTALNYGTQRAKGELILILDSDDYLSDDAIQLIKQYWGKYKHDEDICGIYKDKLFDECVSNMIDFKYNKGNLADMCEVMRKDILLKYPYPVFENEKFLSEVIVTGEIAKKYNTAYIPKEIYYTQYLEDGLSLNWLKNVVNNPLGARANSLLFMSKRFKLIIRIKNCITYNVYSIIAHKSVMKDTKMKFCCILFYIPSYIIAKILVKKYKNNKGY